jgi:hypothetical protein
LARKRALFFRATYVPSLLSALAPSRGAEEREAFADRLQEGLWQRLVNHRSNSFVGIPIQTPQGPGMQWLSSLFLSLPRSFSRL